MIGFANVLKLPAFVFLTLLLSIAPGFAEEPVLPPAPEEPVAEAPPVADPEPATDPEPQSDPSLDDRRRKTSYVIPAIEIIAFNFALNRFDYKFLEDKETFAVTKESIRRNLRGPWQIDNDPFSVNQFLHPYHGSIYHTTARSAGVGFWPSTLYTFFGSALWEIAGETEAPSKNDQVASGIGGVFFGEPLFRMANLALEESNGVPKLGRVLGAAVISPMTGFNRLVFGNRFDAIFPGHEPAYSAKWTIGATVAERRLQGTSRRERRNEAMLDLSFSYGLPGKPTYIYRRPFDYFNFELSAVTSNVFENIMTRGLIVGREYGAGDSYDGLWGLYGSYDYIAPDVFRISTTAVSVGTTGQWRVPGPFTLQGTTLVGVGYGAGGTLEGTATDRDYHYGLTPQGLLSFRLIFGSVATLDVTGRGYRITTKLSTADRGWENVGRADATLTMRLFGPHALSVKYLMNRRYAQYPDLGIRDQRRDTVSLAYTFIRDRSMGAVR